MLVESMLAQDKLTEDMPAQGELMEDKPAADKSALSMLVESMPVQDKLAEDMPAQSRLGLLQREKFTTELFQGEQHKTEEPMGEPPWGSGTKQGCPS
jgi:hypothetical protein